MSKEHLEAKGLEPEIHGIAPQKSLDLTAYSGAAIPNDWQITGVTGDILMVEYADTDGDNEEVMRDGLYLPAGVSNKVWRVGRIELAGPGASDQAIPGAYVMFPSDKGIPCMKFSSKDYIFLNEKRIFAFVQPKD